MNSRKFLTIKKATTTTAIPATTTLKLNSIDATSLALSISLPIIAFLVLLIIVLFLVYMIAKRRREEQLAKKKTMFPKSEINTVSQQIVEQKPGVSEKYRTGYKMDNSNIKDKDFMKILEG